jgi:putative phosphoribosyl transferase
MNPATHLARSAVEQEVSINCGKLMLEGILGLPKSATGIVLFVHGSGSSRHSPRNRFVARALQSEGIATLLFDLLTHDEEIEDQRTAQVRFDIQLLAKRLVGATRWVMQDSRTHGLKVGYFGASTGAAAALVAAAQLRETVAAVVSRGGRPDLAAEALGLVGAPTLLIVGGNDEHVIQLNRQALARLRDATKKLIVIPGATHLFEEPGALEEVARVAGEWLTHYLAPAAEPPIHRDTHSLWSHKGGAHGE